MPPFVVFLVNLAVALCLALAAARRQPTGMSSRRSATLAALPLVDAGLVAAFVFGEDSYRGNGVSRWDAYRSPGGALGLLFVLSIALMIASAALILLAALRRHRRLLRLTTVGAGLTAFVLLTSTIIGFSTN